MDVTVQYNGDAEELKTKIKEAIMKANEELMDNDINVNFEPTEDRFMNKIKIPDEAYDENGDLKENYRKGYKTAIEDYRKENHRNEVDDDVPKPLEIADATTMDLKYIINNLFENTGIVNDVRLRFKKSQTSTILKTLAQYETMLNGGYLTWSIKSYYDEDIELKFTRG